jgi:two-component system cell cycle sensor histidine kinase/response regulator CckA
MNQSIQILIVDDEPRMLRAHARLLRAAGYQVSEAATGHEALRLAQETEPDLILLDVVLPDMRGIEVCRRIKAEEALAESYVVLLSDLETTTDSRTEGLEAGADGYIVRPISRRELVARLEAMLRIKRAERALRRERDLVALLMETSPIGITMVDRRGGITFANIRAEQVLGLTGEAITQRTYNAPEWCITDYGGGPFPDEQLPFRQVMDTGQPVYDVRHAIEWPDGRRVLLSINGAPLFDSSGQVEGVVFTIEDITEQVRAEEALQEEGDRAQKYLDIAGVVFVAINLTGEVTLMNQKGRELFGYAQEEVIGKNWFDDFVPARLRDGVRAVFQRLIDGEVEPVEYYENPVLTKSDGERIIAWHNIVLRDEGGNIVGTLSSGEDVTERKRIEAALRESEDHYRDLVEHSHDLVCTHDLEGRILSVNPAAATLLGYDQSVLLNMNLRDILAPEFRDGFDTYLAAVQKHGVSSGLMRVRTSTGERRIWEYDNILRVEGLAEPIVRGMAHDVTERVRAERALKESEERYRSLFEGVPVGLYRTTPEGQILVANLAMVEMLGYPDRESLVAVDAASLYMDPAARGREQTLLEQEGLVRGAEMRLRRRDGTIIWVRDTARAVRDAGGRLLYYEGSLEDITDRKRAAEALQQYAERLRALRAIDGAILAAWSPEEIAQAALRHTRQLVPCRGAGILTFDFEAQGLTLSALHAEGDVGVEAGMHLPLAGDTEIEALRQGRVLVEQDLESLGRDAQPPPVIQAIRAVGVRSYVGAPLIARGELIGILALASDRPGAFAPEHADIAREVADQLAVALHQARLRAALEAEEQRLEILVQHLPEGILLLDSERRLLLCNPVAKAYLLALTDAAIGDVVTHLGGCQIEELLQSPPEGLWHELEVAGPPRQVFEIVAQPMAAESGGGGWVLLIRNVTVERDTQERAQRQERLAAVGQLAGGIAHDFNNLLTTIMLYAQMPLARRDLPPDLARALETILDESRQAAKLVQQILDFSRRSPIKTQPVELKPFIKEAVRVLERTIPESIRLRLEVGAGEYVVNADPTRVQQVLMNLVVNARDAMPEGGELGIDLSGVEVRPGARPPVAEMLPGEWVCLAISDTGTGIGPDVLPYIFEPFFTTKGPGEGAGLGLAQVYGIVGQHGGHIGVETKVGQGTTFRVYLPAHRGEGMEEAEVGKTEGAPRGRGETILLVEDEQRIREVGRRTLESLGYRVLTAENGREALEVYQSAGGVHLVITDMVMPEMGGRELVQELRKTTPDLKALAITGYIMQGDLRELEEEGFLDVVHKPFDVGTLAEVVRHILDVD